MNITGITSVNLGKRKSYPTEMTNENINERIPGYFFGGAVKEMSSLLTSAEREETMRLASNGGVKILVASDQMARGIDLAHIKLVINYDPPKHARSYVHRVGRTARANRSGHCITFLKQGQVGAFKAMRKEIAPLARFSKYRPPVEDAARDLNERYQYALGRLQQVLSSETDRVFSEGQDISEDLF